MSIRHLTRPGLLPFMLLLYLAVQVPFLNADPHTDIAPTSRDAYTDEGLNTSQVINRVNHGHWVIDECDNLIKTPLFSLWLFPAYSLFGTSAAVGHMWLLLGCMLLLWAFSRKHGSLPWVAGVFLLLSLTQYHLFQYIRFTMGELSACFLVLVAAAYALRYGNGRSLWDLVWAGLFLWAAVFVKNQFGYVLLLLPVWALAAQLVNGRLWHRHTFTALLTACTVLLLGAAFYYVAWYLPVKDTYDYVMRDQASGRFIPRELLRELGTMQAKAFLRTPYMRYYAALCLLAAGVFVLNFFGSKNRNYRLLSLFSLAWAVLELHKFAMRAVPSRYLTPLLFAWGLFAAVQLVWAVKNALDKGTFARLVAGGFVSVALCVFVLQLVQLRKLYDERQFVIHETNLMLSKVDFGDRPAVGPWAPALARETGARVLPVWYGYFNDKDILRKLNPKVVVSEKNEDDSGGAFKNDGINLAALADSVKEVKVARYEILIYYLP